MNMTMTARPCKTLLIIGSLLLILCLIPCKSWGELPNLTFAFSTSENTIDVGHATASGAVALTTGGGVLNVSIGGTQAVMVVSFGQPFAGSAFSPGVSNSSIAQGDSLKNSGAAFLQDNTIYKMGMVDEGRLNVLGKLNNGPATYDKDALGKAEAAYRQALFVDPFNDSAVEGILSVRQAIVLKNNLVWDIKRRDQLRLRLTSTAPQVSGQNVLNGEIQILEDNSDITKNSVGLILELFSDPAFRGPGALLRGEFSIAGSDVFAGTMKLLFSSGRRFAETEYWLANKNLLLDFFTDQNRTGVLGRLANAHAYLTELMRLVNPYIDDSFNGTSELLSLTSWQRKLNELANLIQQGYNPFGFLPDFVPFLTGQQENNNLSTFNQLYQIAEDAATLSKGKDDFAKTQEDKFAQSSAEYLQRVLDLNNSYKERLKSLVGVVTYNGSQEPDLFTYLVPDRDLDGDGMSERDKQRLTLTQAHGWQFGSKGTIGLQYDTIANAEDRIRAAFNDLQNNYKEIEIRDQTARAVFGISEEIAQLVLSTGERVSVLTREKGRLTQEADQEIADRQRNDNTGIQLFGAGLGVMGAIVGAATANPGAVLESFGGIVSSINQYQSAQTAGDISDIQGQLAQDLANVDAEINDVQAMTNATIEVKRGEQELLRTEQEIQLLVLKQANLRLTLEMSRRDRDREMSTLWNMIDEANTLLVGLARGIKLAEVNQGNALGWMEDDVRDVLTNSVEISDQAFYRAQVWTFIALRALEYYANKAPDTNGQPDPQIKSLYEGLYSARRAQDLVDLLTTTKSKATSDFVFTLTNIECPSRALLSLKYDVLVPTLAGYQSSGQPSGVEKETLYKYQDPSDGQVYTGAKAYQAAFRNALRQGLTGAYPFRKLTLVFGTDLFPRRRSVGANGVSVTGDNPFYVASGTNAKIIGFTNSNCSGPGLSTNIQGIQINLTGDLSGQFSAPHISLAQLGNSYLRHTKWTQNDFDPSGRLINPLRAIAVYSTYVQVLPTWLVGDVDQSTTTPEQRIGSAVVAVFPALLNGQGTGAGGEKTLAFTDRSVANDRWELTIWEPENAAWNGQFLDNLEQMLKSPVPENPSSDFLTDIQLWIGWAYRNPNIY